LEEELNKINNSQQDLSPQVISLARAIDRLLPDQNYVIHLKKPTVHGESWEVSISIENVLRIWTIPKEKNRSE
jgi:hypothetical protein